MHPSVCLSLCLSVNRSPAYVPVTGCVMMVMPPTLPSFRVICSASDLGAATRLYAGMDAVHERVCPETATGSHTHA